MEVSQANPKEATQAIGEAQELEVALELIMGAQGMMGLDRDSNDT